MKTLIARLSVLTLAATGFAAATVVSQSPRPEHVVKVPAANVPYPMCTPPDGSKCGY